VPHSRRTALRVVAAALSWPLAGCSDSPGGSGGSPAGGTGSGPSDTGSEAADGETNGAAADATTAVEETGHFVEPTVNLRAGSLSASELPDGFTLTDRAARPEVLAATAALTDAYTNRFVDRGGDAGAAFVRSDVARYRSRAAARNGVAATLARFDRTVEGTRRRGPSLGAYQLYRFENDRRYGTTLVVSRYGNLAHAVVVTGGTTVEPTAVELARRQRSRLQRLAARPSRASREARRGRSR